MPLSHRMPLISTARLDLRPATPDDLRAELDGRDALEKALGVTVPGSWPPDLYDRAAMRYSLDWLLSHPAEGAWGPSRIVRRARDGGLATLIGVCGFKGAPSEAGEVELGYGVLAEHRRQGYASEAVRAMVAYAFSDARVRVIVGQTLASLAPSIGVLEKCGFQHAGAGSDDDVPPGETVVRYELRRA